MTNEIMLGSVGISVLLMIFLRLIYGSFEVPKKLKPWIAVAGGMTFALVAMAVGEAPITGKLAVKFMVDGFMIGATAVGLNEITPGKKKAPPVE